MSERSLRMPPDGIMCFHCGEVFTTFGSAEQHFGATQDAEAGCLIDRVALEKGGGVPDRGRGLLAALRRAEHEIAELRYALESRENYADMFNSQTAELERRFGVRDVHTAWMRYDDEKFRADHAMKRLAEAGISFDETASAVGA